MTTTAFFYNFRRNQGTWTLLLENLTTDYLGGWMDYGVDGIESRRVTGRGGDCADLTKRDIIMNKMGHEVKFLSNLDIRSNLRVTFLSK